MIGDVPISVLVFAVFIIPLIIEAIAFGRLNEWCTGIGLRTARLGGPLPMQKTIDTVALQNLGFYVKALSDQRILLRPFTTLEERAREGRVTFNPRAGLIGHIAVLTLGKTHWILEVYMPWLFWTFLLVMFGHLLVLTGTGGALGGFGVAFFVCLVAITFWNYRSGRNAYRKVVELIERGA